MIKIEAPTLEDAFSEASQRLNCSITDLVYEVVQNPSKGLLGLFKKNAIIVASCPNKSLPQLKATVKEPEKNHRAEQKQKQMHKEIQKETPKATQRELPKEPLKVVNVPEVVSKESKSIEKAVVEPSVKNSVREVTVDHSIENFYKERIDIESACQIIEDELNVLFENACFELDRIVATVYDKDTILIKFDGSDSALLIGKDGYGYKAISYMLFNWINPRFEYNIRLEIAEFLHNQEDMIKNYLIPIKEQVRNVGRSQTKVLDGVLVQIALRELRSEFSDKYIAVKENHDGGKYIIITNFNRKNDD